MLRNVGDITNNFVLTLYQLCINFVLRNFYFIFIYLCHCLLQTDYYYRNLHYALPPEASAANEGHATAVHRVFLLDDCRRACWGPCGCCCCGSLTGALLRSVQGGRKKKRRQLCSGHFSQSLLLRYVDLECSSYPSTDRRSTKMDRVVVHGPPSVTPVSIQNVFNHVVGHCVVCGNSVPGLWAAGLDARTGQHL
jgi:hypothetical protein